VLDLKAIRGDPDGVRSALARRGEGPARTLDRVLELDARRRALLPELEQRRASKNAASKRIGELRREGGDASGAIAEVRDASGLEQELDAQLAAVQLELDAAVLSLPNPPAESAAREDTVVREVGDAGASGRDHLELLDGQTRWLSSVRAPPSADWP